MKVRVIKFGGTSVANAECFRRLAALIAQEVEAQEMFPVVVVSAMAGVTDLLFEMAGDAARGRPYAPRLAGLRQRHLIAVEQSAYVSRERPSFLTEMATAFEHLERDLAQIDQAGEWALASVSAWGERLSVLLLSATLRAAGVNAEAVREEVIVTEAPAYFRAAVGAEPLSEETGRQVRWVLAPLIARAVVPIVPGFIARSADGKQTLLGRGGSDRTATLIAAALAQCEEVCIYTDVNGILSADPRVVREAQRLPQLSYGEAAQLAWCGAKVLHPQTLIPIGQLGIPVYVKNSFAPDEPGTVIGPHAMLRGEMGALALRRHLALVGVRGTDLFEPVECVARGPGVLASAGIVPFAMVASTGNQHAFVVEESLADTCVALLQDTLGGAQVTCRKGLAACTYVGGDMLSDLVRPGCAITSLAAAEISVAALSLSDQGLILLVRDVDAERAICELHAALVPSTGGVPDDAYLVSAG